uniref:Secreted protein n=1 Tax=Ascaris lumbricoides TaxID=6252 RepID=A0A0M3IFV4_ASCLU
MQRLLLVLTLTAPEERTRRASKYRKTRLAQTSPMSTLAMKFPPGDRVSIYAYYTFIDNAPQRCVFRFHRVKNARNA